MLPSVNVVCGTAVASTQRPYNVEVLVNSEASIPYLRTIAVMLKSPKHDPSMGQALKFLTLLVWLNLLFDGSIMAFTFK
jgi:hypothetical protein